MQRARTVVVLGAGASKPYGFPLGEELKKEILDAIESPILFVNFGFRQDEVASFREALELGQPSTFDDLLDRKKSFRRIAPLAIAKALLPMEQTDILLKTRDWYARLFDLLGFESEDTDASWLTIVTLNYDRSLEHFLAKSIEVECCEDRVEFTRKKLKSIRIIHAHGSLGSYPKVRYGVTILDLLTDASILRRAAKSIRLVSDRLEDTRAFQEAQKAISQAERIMFIGFGYDERAVRRLFQGEIPSDKQIVGTCYRLPPDDVNRVRTLFNNNIGLVNRPAVRFIEML